MVEDKRRRTNHRLSTSSPVCMCIVYSWISHPPKTKTDQSRIQWTKFVNKTERPQSFLCKYLERKNFKSVLLWNRTQTGLLLTHALPSFLLYTVASDTQRYWRRALASFAHCHCQCLSLCERKYRCCCWLSRRYCCWPTFYAHRWFFEWCFLFLRNNHHWNTVH